jgi:hypothetical protein
MKTTAKLSVKVMLQGNLSEIIELDNVNGVTIQEGIVFFWADAGSQVSGEKETSTMIFMVPTTRLVYMVQADNSCITSE